MTIYFTDDQWVRLLSDKHTQSQERVIVTGKMTATLRIRKKDWHDYFSDFEGIGFKQGNEIELIPQNNGGPNSKIPQWVMDRLAAIPGDKLCITDRENKFYRK